MNWYQKLTTILGQQARNFQSFIGSPRKLLWWILQLTNNVVVEQLLVVPKEKTPDDMRMIFEDESTDLLFIAERSKRSDTSKPTGRHNVFTPFPRDPNCEVCKLTKTTRAPCRNRPDARWDRVHHPQPFEDLLPADHKVLTEENECLLQHSCAVVGQDLFFFLSKVTQRKNKIAQETMTSLQKFVLPDQESGNTLEFVRASEDMC